MLTVGTFHTCGLTSEGKAYCWGENVHGQLGDGTTTNRSTPVAVVGALTFKTLEAGGGHTCGITTEGASYCWGHQYTAPGDETPRSRLVPVPVPGGLDFVSLSLGPSYSCGLTAGGRAYCWGWNGFAQFGNGKEVVSGACDPTAEVCWNPVPAATGLTLRTLEAGSFHACGLTLEGRVYCWGDNGFGQLGEGTTDPSLTPIPISSGLRYAELSGGLSYACARTADGVAYCWGALPWEALEAASRFSRDNKLTIPSRPAAVEAQQLGFRSVSVGYEVACGLTDAGAAHCWGDNVYGQLGQDGTGPYRLNPEPVLGGRTFQSLVAGYQRVCGLTADGSAYCWGRNDQGQLGDGTTLDRALPVAVVRGP